MKRQALQPYLPFSNDDNKGSVTISPKTLKGLDVLEEKMYLSLKWFDAAHTPGKSFTTVFTVSNKSLDGSELADYLQSLPDTTPYREEGYTLQGNPVILKNATSYAATQSTTPITAGSSTATALSSNDDGEGQSGGNSKLEPGVIAGIVIGSVIGVLLIIALAYFLCFRRRAGGKQQRRHIHGDVGYASDSGAAAMMMREKDMSGVNHGSPQSAFADDGGRLHDRGAVGHGNDSTTYSSTPPYQEEKGGGSWDRDAPAAEQPQSYAADSAIGVAVSGAASSGPHAERERNGSVGGGTVGRASHQTSRPVSEVRSPSRYAHLIEEGMTEDEIRRLEDEERQLDAAIEDAGRHGRPK
ncbi:hypothetical protein PG985_002799 [Apiospora marii]|uniref:uncharacterized protein n=1 Tax=Apiospora marii TaxID=335849 RepID=UPI0031328C29